MSSKKLRDNEFEFTPTLGIQHLRLEGGKNSFLYSNEVIQKAKPGSWVMTL